MQIIFDDEMRALIDDLKFIDWHETYICATRQDPTNCKKLSALVVDGLISKHIQRTPDIHLEYWSVGELMIILLNALAYGFTVDAPENRFTLAMLETIRRHCIEKPNVSWTTWEMS